MQKHSIRVVHTSQFNRLTSGNFKRRKITSPWIHPRPTAWVSVLLIFLAIGMLVVSAKISIPIHPFAVTLQPLVVLFLGMICGMRIAVIAVLLYLLLGFLKLPILISTDYALVWGYFLGFVLAAAVTGFLTERGWGCHIFSTTITTLIGILLIELCGWAVLAKSLGAMAALRAGVEPFILLDVLIIIFLAILVPMFWQFFITVRRAPQEDSPNKKTL